MQYDAVAQQEQTVSPRASPHSPGVNSHDLPSFPTSQDELETKTRMEDNAGPDDPLSSRLSSLIRSFTFTQSSYDMVEDDDYEEPLRTSPRVTNGDLQKPTPATSIPRRSLPQNSLPERPVPYRTASISRDLPMNHPAPDLQSLQGAYVKNVERLEESAERLSMTSSLEEELQKMKFEQRQRSRQSSRQVNSFVPLSIDTGRFSAGSFTSSILGLTNTAMSGGLPPSPYVTSPRESALSGSWSQPSAPRRTQSKRSNLASPLTDTDRKPTPLDLDAVGLLRQGPSAAHQSAPPSHNQVDPTSHQTASQELANDRPPTSASNDTSRQVANLFLDFDGVHFTHHPQGPASSQTPRGRQLSLTRPPLASDPTSFREPQPGADMVFYPAPVPTMLNLPQKLSKQLNATERERRRLKGLSGIPEEMRKSAVWPQENGDKSALKRRSIHALAGLPPQLRASAFFHQPPVSQDIEIKGGSAMATLDSILDASAHAPVSAFTDHPIVGQLGKEVYGKEKSRKSVDFDGAEKKKRQSTLSNMLRTSIAPSTHNRVPSGQMTDFSRGQTVSRESNLIETEEEGDSASGEDRPLRTSEDLDNAAQKCMPPDDDELADEDGKIDRRDEVEPEEDSDESEISYLGAPTTLLAELQMRKARQRQRNRTAATAFPNGMRSTLLELDAIAQLQQKSRKQKHVTLAWEDHDLANQQEFDDEDMPLAMVMAKNQNDINRPLGLMERRELEDNEPLSHRRARLRGEPVPSLEQRLEQRSVVQEEPSKPENLDLPQLTSDELEEQEEETLGQRLKRLRAQKGGASDFATDFTKEVSSQLGLKTEPEVVPSKTPDIEETLGQRKRRLQQEALQASGQVGVRNSQEPKLGLKSRRSMADILQAHLATGAQLPPQESRGLIRHINKENTPPQQAGAPAMASMIPAEYPFNYSMPQPNPFSYHGDPIINAVPMHNMQYGVAQLPVYIADPMTSPPLDPKQRIDRWRQGVVQ